MLNQILIAADAVVVVAAAAADAVLMKVVKRWGNCIEMFGPPVDSVLKDYKQLLRRMVKT